MSALRPAHLAGSSGIDAGRSRPRWSSRGTSCGSNGSARFRTGIRPACRADARHPGFRVRSTRRHAWFQRTRTASPRLWLARSWFPCRETRSRATTAGHDRLVSGRLWHCPGRFAGWHRDTCSWAYWRQGGEWVANCYSHACCPTGLQTLHEPGAVLPHGVPSQVASHLGRAKRI